jgi:hypothetical protein
MTNKIVTLNMLPGGIAHVVIDTPDSKLNVLSQAFFSEFTAVLSDLEARTDVKGLGDFVWQGRQLLRRRRRQGNSFPPVAAFEADL